MHFKNIDGRPLFMLEVRDRDVKVPIDLRPEIAVQLGRLVAHWSAVETNLGFVLERLLAIADQEKSQRKADIVFQSVVSMTAKLKMMRLLAVNSMPEGDQKSGLDQLLERAEKLSMLRNDYVHASWGLFEGELGIQRLSGQFWSLKGTFKPLTPISATTLQADISRISELHADLHHWLFGEAAGK